LIEERELVENELVKRWLRGERAPLLEAERGSVSLSFFLFNSFIFLLYKFQVKIDVISKIK
jgi:hypothetical protein